MNPLDTTDLPARDPLLAPVQILKHTIFFVVTFFTTMIAGMLWRNETDLVNIELGLTYSIALLFILASHEFGHYFAARHHRVPVTLPYFIPLPPVDIVGFGTLGAVIRTKRRISSVVALFDIGIAGPIAGFIASLLVLAVGFLTLPGTDFLLAIHPDFDFVINNVPGLPPGTTMTFGMPAMYTLMQGIFAPAGAYVPPMWEMYHYPLLITGWFGLLVTAMNLLPAGQLDGGHILYAMFPKLHGFIARGVVILLAFLGGMGFLPTILAYLNFEDTAIYIVENFGNYYSVFWPGWFLWSLIILFVIKVDHPQVDEYQELDTRRRALGFFAFLMFILCAVPAPIFFQ